MKRLLLLSVFMWPAMALADGPTNLPILDSSSATHNMNTIKDPSGFETFNASGYNSGTTASATATPSASSHAAGTSIGGKLSVPLARVNGGSGVITNFNYISSGGATTAFVIRLWDKNPASTTCTDNTAFASNATDDAHLLTQPLTITPAPPAVTTGDTKTYVGMSGLTWDYQNQDTSIGKNIYVCIVTVSTDTADESNAIRVTLTGPQN